MSDQPERRYTEDGSIIRECECALWHWDREKLHWVRREEGGEFAGFPPMSPGPFMCTGYADKYCGSFCDASGYATPGTLVLWEAHRRLARDLIRTDAAHYQCTGSALIPLIGIATSEDEIQRANTAAANACAEARATLAAREGA